MSKTAKIGKRTLYHESNLSLNSDSSCIKACSASTVKENDIYKRYSCLHKQNTYNITTLVNMSLTKRKVCVCVCERAREGERGRLGTFSVKIKIRVKYLTRNFVTNFKGPTYPQEGIEGFSNQ